MSKKLSSEELKRIAEDAKKLRRDSLNLAIENYSSHFGGMLSVADLLITAYNHVLREDDQLILSKGHACYAQYVLLRERGFNPKLECHPSIDESNGIYATTGSLGHGLPISIGKAMARKIMGKPGRIYTIMGDGECQEGTTWEGLLTAPFRKLDNLHVVVDCNGIGGSGRLRDILPVRGTLEAAAISAGWQVSEMQGHDYQKIIDVLDSPIEKDKPKLTFAYTLKGKGVSFMENNPAWHSKRINPEQLKQAMEELK